MIRQFITDKLNIIRNNIITCIGVSGGMGGAYMVSQGYALEANIIWLCCNPFLLYHSLKMGENGQALMFSVYTVFAIIGVYNLW